MPETTIEPDEISETLVYALAASPLFGVHPRAACFAATGAGLLVSRDGAAWQDAFAGLQVSGPSVVTALAISPDFEKDGSVFAGVSGGVLRSADGGRGWNSAIFPPPVPMVSSLVISPNFAQDGTLFAGTMEDGVLISTDAGTHWAAWNFGLLDLNILALAISPTFEQDETIWAGSETGLFCSTNGGRAWREVVLPAGQAAVTALAVSPGFAADRTLFAGTDGSGLFRSLDGGAHWQPVGQTAGLEQVNQLLLAPLAGAPTAVWAISGDALLVSPDAGENWGELPVSGEDGMLCAACLLPGGGLLAGFTGNKFARIL